MMDKGREKVVHLFPQPSWHEDAIIIGNRNGLLALKSAIETALKTGKADCILMPADGENFNCKVLLNNEDWRNPFWQRMKTPYAELSDDDPNALLPYDYVQYHISKSDDIPNAEKTMERNRKVSEEYLQKIMETMEKNKEQE